MGALGDLRALVAATLTGLAPTDDDWPVHDSPVDAITAPCYVLVWPEPWVMPATVCTYNATLDVICVAARVDPAPGYEQLEALIGAAVPALVTAGLVFVAVGGAGPLEVGGLTYQAARIRLSQPVTF